MTRIGKIARLPDALRDELNRRLREGESGPRLLAWLNSQWAMWAKHPEKIPKPHLRWDDEIRHLTRMRF